MGAAAELGRGPSSRRLLASVLVATAILAGCGSSTPTVAVPASSIPVTSVPSPLPTDTTAPVGGTPAASAAPPASPAAPVPGEPDPVMTPGAVNPAVTQANIRTTICVSGWTATVRPPASYTTALKIRQIAAYDYTDTKLADYEEDHLISLEIGGAPRDPLNLWPEPYAVSLPDGTAVGARAKDQLENYLHKQVCAGHMTLKAAQGQIARHWVAAWMAAGLDPGPSASGAP